MTTTRFNAAPAVRPAAFKPNMLALSVAACFGMTATGSLANPTGGSVASGSASITASGNVLSITNSANAVINWAGFSIGVNEITRFIQGSSASAVLNRVVGAGGVIPQSVINGMLQSNGRVFLLNPNGIVIGAGARIDVAGFVASSLAMSDADFINGRMRFTEVPGAGGVVNNGVIETTNGGRVFLVGPDVKNNGIIRSPEGQIVLAAGKSVELLSENSPYVTVKVNADTEQALNVGSLIADSGRAGMYGALVRNTGVVAANSVTVGANGDIQLVASKSLTLDAGSSVSASGASGGKVLLQATEGTTLIAGTVEAKGSSGKGGEVQALGVRVGVIGNGVIDASGDTGGGTVLVGGDYQGKNLDVQNAQHTLIDAGGVIRADAGSSGDGGKVIVWADGDTRFYGSISAKGGSQSGNGGFVETSGKQNLIAFGNVNTSAAAGNGGTWLLDQYDLDIVLSVTPNPVVPTGPGGLINFGDTPTTGVSQITVSALDAAMTSNGSVIAQATNDITLTTDLTLSATGNLTAQANNNINSAGFNTDIKGNLQLTADADFNGAGAIVSFAPHTTTPVAPGNITTNGGAVDLYGTSITVGNINTINGGPVSNNPSRVNIYAQTGSVKTGTITTGFTDNGSADIYVRGVTGIETGALTTGAGFGGYSSSSNNVYVANVGTGPVTIGGDITTGSTGHDYSNSSVYLHTNSGDISTQAINTGAASGNYSDSHVTISTGLGSITTNNNAITTGNANNGSAYVRLEATTSISTGNMTTALTGDSQNTSVVLTNSGVGNVFTGAITTGLASNTSTVQITNRGGEINTNGGVGASYKNITTGGGDGGESGGAHVDLKAGTGIHTGAINTAVSASSPNTSVSLNTTSGPISTDAITTAAAGSLYWEPVNSSVALTTSSGGIIVNGSIQTGSAFSEQNSADSSVTLSNSVSGDIHVNGKIETGPATSNAIAIDPYYDQFKAKSSVSLYTNSGDITVDDIVKTGTAYTASSLYSNSAENWVNLQTNAGAITTGAITTAAAWTDGGSASSDSSVNLRASTDITVSGAVRTGDSDESYVYASGGVIFVDGEIKTGDAANGSSKVSLFANSGVTLNGDITTGSAPHSNVHLETYSGGITVGGSIQTGGGNYDSDVYMYANSGDITVTGDITTGLSGNTYYNDDGSRVSITAYAGKITTGRVTTSGADGAEGYVSMSATTGITTGDITTNTSGNVESSSVYLYTSSGSISTGAITTGAAYDAGVSLNANSGISTGDIRTDGTGYGYNRQVYLSNNGTGDVITGAITTRRDAPNGSGGYVSIYTQAGHIRTAGIDTRVSDAIYSYYGGGSVNLVVSGGTPDATPSIMVNGAIQTGGGTAAPGGGYYYQGGSGGYVSLQAPGLIQVAGPIVTIGGGGGSGNMYANGGSAGGGGGNVFIAAGTGVSTGAIFTNGGNGGAGFDDGVSLSGSGGAGGNAGAVNITTTSGKVELGTPFDQFADPNIVVASIVANGGVGGAGGAAHSPAGGGGAGGAGGALTVEGNSVQINGYIFTTGGGGGAGGAGNATDAGGSGGAGGAGGGQTMTSASTITFVNGGSQFGGGAGGLGGSDGGMLGGTNGATGATGPLAYTGQLVFIQTALPVTVTVPVVNIAPLITPAELVQVAALLKETAVALIAAEDQSSDADPTSGLAPTASGPGSSTTKKKEDKAKGQSCKPT